MKIYLQYQFIMNLSETSSSKETDFNIFRTHVDVIEEFKAGCMNILKKWMVTFYSKDYIPTNQWMFFTELQIECKVESMFCCN